jgi:hypothetical protein
VPWAHDSSISFIETPAETRSLLNAVGFHERDWHDYTEDAIAFFKAREAKAASDGIPILSPATILGSDFRQHSRNLIRNYEEGRLVAAMALFDRK